MPIVNLDSQEDRERLLASAKAGKGECVATLLNLYCHHLRILAETRLDARLRARVSPSDVVQETLYEAHCGFAQFRGQCEAEFLAWLRRILANNLALRFRASCADGQTRRATRSVNRPDRRIAGAVLLRDSRISSSTRTRPPAPKRTSRRGCWLCRQRWQGCRTIIGR